MNHLYHRCSKSRFFVSLPIQDSIRFRPMSRISSFSSAHLWPLPQHWEMFGLLLPRPLLDWAEIHAFPEQVTDSSLGKDLLFWRSRKIALVKQTAYHALYPQPGKGSWQETVLSSACHLGPFSFLADLGADYHVVRQASEPETFLWKEKQAYDPDPANSFRHKMKEIHKIESSLLGRELPSVDDISWDKFDMVIGIDIPIPERIVRQCPRTLWAYYSIEAGGPLQKNSLLRPAAGYNLFLNHGFRRYRSRPRNRPHVLEFPLQFQSPQSWEKLRQVVKPSPERSVILIERNSWADVLPASRIPLDRPSGNAFEYLHKMFSAFACLHTTPRSRWGNWAVESVLSGSVFLGNAQSLAQISPLLPGMDCRSLQKGVDLANRLIEDPPFFDSVQKLQTQVVEHVAFRRPLNDLTRKSQEFFT